MLGPVHAASAALNTLAVLGAAALGRWTSLHEAETADLDSDERREEREWEEAMLASLAARYPEGDQRWERMRESRAHKHYPAWISRLGGYKAALALVLGMIAAGLALSLAVRPLNYFELVDVPPAKLKRPEIGLLIKRGLDRGLHPSARDLGEEAVVNITKVLRDSELRLLYEAYGRTQVRMRTVADLLVLCSDMFVTYGFWFGLLVLLSATMPRCRDAFVSGSICLGVVFFLDLSIFFDDDGPGRLAALNLVPLMATTTTFERLCLLRHFLSPALLSACVLYSNFAFVDAAESEFLELLVLQSQVDDTLKSMNEIIKGCRGRRELRNAVEAKVAEARGASGGPAEPASDATSAAGSLRRRRGR